MYDLSSLRHAALGCLLCGLAGSTSQGGTGRQALAPPSSLEPPEAPVTVRVTHRHRAVRQCVSLKEPRICTGRELEADTATTVRFERVGVSSAAMMPDTGTPHVTFPRHVGPQEQSIKLAVGDWLVDWPGAPSIGHLRVAAGAHPLVSLVTSSGRCRFEGERCELDSVRSRQLAVHDDVVP
ncbi:MAG TPA: hypothetical protein VHB79_04360 [Polyangiaceae bacterium]|nr:hypothetical protein [Polyangiaceae bacterium]